MEDINQLLSVRKMEAAQDKEQEEEQEKIEALQNISIDLESLEKSRQQLELIKESLSMEKNGRISANRERQVAEANINARVADLESAGLSKEELLSNPEYEGLKEVKAVSEALAQEEVYSAASVGSEELKAKLDGLGIELPEGEVDERLINRAIESKISELDTNIFETRFKIPSEREKIISEIIATYKLKIDDLVVVSDSGYSFREEGSYKDLASKLESELRSIPIAKSNQEVKNAIIQKVVKDALLAKNKTYQEKKGNREAYEDRLTAYEDAKEKLPEYLEFLNTGFFDPLNEALSKIDTDVANDLWNSSELIDIKNIFEINFREKKIIGLNIAKNALPSVKEMEGLMSSSEKPWDSGRLYYSLEGVKSLENVTYEHYRNRRQDVFKGNLRAIALELSTKETLPETRRPTEETYEKWDAAFEKTENRAEVAANNFIKYITLNDELKGQDTREVGTEKEKIDSEFETLHKASIELRDTDEFRVESGRLINVVWEKQKLDILSEKTTIQEEKVRLEEKREAQGTKPEGFFSGGKKEAWEKERSRLDLEIGRIVERVEHIDHWLQSTNEDWSSRYKLPSEIIEKIKGTTTSGGKISGLVYQRMDELRPQITKLEQIVRNSDDKIKRVKDMEKQRFQRDTYNDFSETSL